MASLLSQITPEMPPMASSGATRCAEEPPRGLGPWRNHTDLPELRKRRFHSDFALDWRLPATKQLSLDSRRPPQPRPPRPFFAADHSATVEALVRPSNHYMARVLHLLTRKEHQQTSDLASCLLLLG